MNSAAISDILVIQKKEIKPQRKGIFLRTYTNIDSKFRFVILASMRAKELLRGAKPKIRVKSKNLICIAQEEVKRGLIGYEIIQPKKEESDRPEDEIFIGEELALEGELEAKESKDDLIPEEEPMEDEAEPAEELEEEEAETDAFVEEEEEEKTEKESDE